MTKISALTYTRSVVLCAAAAALAVWVPVVAAADVAEGKAPPAPTGEEIVRQCDYKSPGDDSRSKLAITLKDQTGAERKNVYLRLWKDYRGKDNIVDKMVLFTEYPPDAQGAGFMRWAFTPDQDKNADQWIYLPALRNIRRVSVRDPGDSFLGSDLTYFDISGRLVTQDAHKLLKVETVGGEEFYVVETTPLDKNPLYSKRVSWFKKTADWDGCVKMRMDYYDRRGELLKQQAFTWQRVGPAWAWDKVLVQNVQTKHSSLFQVTDVEPNVGVKDDVFSERTLKLGYRK